MVGNTCTDKLCTAATVHFLWWVILVLTNYAQLLLYISYEQSDLYMLVTTKFLLVATTRAQVNVNRVYNFIKNSLVLLRAIGVIIFFLEVIKVDYYQ